MTGRWYGVLRLQGVLDCDPSCGTLPTFIRSGGRCVAYETEAEAMALAATDRTRLKVCRISPEVERRCGVVVAGGVGA